MLPCVEHTLGKMKDVNIFSKLDTFCKTYHFHHPPRPIRLLKAPIWNLISPFCRLTAKCEFSKQHAKFRKSMGVVRADPTKIKGHSSCTNTSTNKRERGPEIYGHSQPPGEYVPHLTDVQTTQRATEQEKCVDLWPPSKRRRLMTLKVTSQLLLD